MSEPSSPNSLRAAIAFSGSSIVWAVALDVLNQKYGTSIPDWTIVIMAYVSAGLWLYWVWHTDFIQRRRRLIYTYPRMALVLMVLTGVVVGGGAGAFLWWTIQREQRARQSQAQPVGESTTVPNIVMFGEPRLTLVSRDQSMIREGGNEWAIVVDFRNEFKPNEEIKGLNNVLSQLTFTSSSGHTLHPVSYGFWLGQESPEATFERGDTRTLYIAKVQYVPEARQWITTLDRRYTPPNEVLVTGGLSRVTVSIVLFTQTGDRFYKTCEVQIVPEIQVIKPFD